MFCGKCGNQVAEGQTFCAACGSRIEQPVNAAGQQPVYQAPTKKVTTHPMGWYKFLIYFGLFAGAAVNLYNGVMALTGEHYDGLKETVYYVFPEMKSTDMIFGVLCIGLAVLGVYARFRLSAYKANAPQMVVSLYLAAIGASVFYLVRVNSIVSTVDPNAMDMSSVMPQLCTSAVMAIVNYVYFKKRADMFVN